MVDILPESSDFEALRKIKIDGKRLEGLDLLALRAINAESAEQELNQPIFNVDNFKLNIENLVNMSGQGNDVSILPEDERKKMLRSAEKLGMTGVAEILVVPATKDLNKLLKAAADKGNVAALNVFIESAKEKGNSAIGKVAQHYINTMDPKKISEFKANNDKAVEESKNKNEELKKREEAIEKLRAKKAKKVLDLPRLSQKTSEGLVIPGSRGTTIRNALSTFGLAKRKPHKEGGKGR